MAKIIRTDLVAGATGSVVTIRNNDTVALENGDFVALGALENVNLGRSTRIADKLTEGCVLAFVDDPAVNYDERLDERDFTVPQGKTCRARRALVGEQITIAKTCIDGAVAVGDKLQVKPTSYQLTKNVEPNKAVAIVLEDTTFEGQASWFIEFL